MSFFSSIGKGLSNFFGSGVGQAIGSIGKAALNTFIPGAGDVAGGILSTIGDIGGGVQDTIGQVTTGDVATTGGQAKVNGDQSFFAKIQNFIQQKIQPLIERGQVVGNQIQQLRQQIDQLKSMPRAQLNSYEPPIRKMVRTQPTAFQDMYAQQPQQRSFDIEKNNDQYEDEQM